MDELRAERLSVAFEGVHALDSVDFSLRRGELLGLIGPNGAGKSTLINALSGVVPASAGRIWMGSDEVTQWPMWRRSRAGLARSFQGARLFRRLTLEENIQVAALGAVKSSRQARRRARALLGDAGLANRASTRANELSAGDQQRLGVLRALVTEPRFLLLDEPAAGLNELEGAALVSTIRSARDQYGCGVLVIEHDMSVIMTLSERVQVLNYGKSLAVGSRDEVRRDPAVIEAYLGTTHADVDG